MSKSELSSVSPMGAKKYIQFVSRFHGFFRHWMERESRVWRLQTRYGSNEEKKFTERWQMEPSVQER